MGSVSSSVFRLTNSLINLVPISFMSNIDLDIAMPWYWNGMPGLVIQDCISRHS